MENLIIYLCVILAFVIGIITQKYIDSQKEKNIGVFTLDLSKDGESPFIMKITKDIDFENPPEKVTFDFKVKG